MGQLLLIVVVAVTVAAVVFGVTVLVSGRDSGLQAAEPDGRAVPLPSTRPLMESDLADVRFDTGARGYRMGQVDQALKRAAYDIGYKDELIGVLEAEVNALRDGRTLDADALRRAREAAQVTTAADSAAAPASTASASTAASASSAASASNGASTASGGSPAEPGWGEFTRPADEPRIVPATEPETVSAPETVPDADADAPTADLTDRSATADAAAERVTTPADEVATPVAGSEVTTPPAERRATAGEAQVTGAPTETVIQDHEPTAGAGEGLHAEERPDDPDTVPIATPAAGPAPDADPTPPVAEATPDPKSAAHADAPANDENPQAARR